MGKRDDPDSLVEGVVEHNGWLIRTLKRRGRWEHFVLHPRTKQQVAKFRFQSTCREWADKQSVEDWDAANPERAADPVVESASPPERERRRERAREFVTVVVGEVEAARKAWATRKSREAPDDPVWRRVSVTQGWSVEVSKKGVAAVLVGDLEVGECCWWDGRLWMFVEPRDAEFRWCVRPDGVRSMLRVGSEGLRVSQELFAEVEADWAERSNAALEEVRRMLAEAEMIKSGDFLPF